MKFRALMMAVLVMALGAVMAYAAPVQVVGVGGGLTMPTGNASDLLGTGFHGGGAYLYKPAAEYGVGLDVSYHLFGEKTVGTTKYKLNALYAGAQGRYFIPMKDAKMAPYIKVGGGMYNLSVKVTDDLGEATTSKSKFGFSGGIGSLFTVNPKNMVGVELMYHMISMGSDKLTTDSSVNVFTATATWNFVL